MFRQRSERFAPVARGEVELGFNQIREILTAPGVDLVGPLPAEIRSYTRLAAATLATSRAPQAAAAFIRFFASADALEVMRARGFEAP